MMRSQRATWTPADSCRVMDHGPGGVQTRAEDERTVLHLGSWHFGSGRKRPKMPATRTASIKAPKTPKATPAPLPERGVAYTTCGAAGGGVEGDAGGVVSLKMRLL